MRVNIGVYSFIIIQTFLKSEILIQNYNQLHIVTLTNSSFIVYMFVVLRHVRLIDL